MRGPEFDDSSSLAIILEVLDRTISNFSFWTVGILSISLALVLATSNRFLMKQER